MSLKVPVSLAVLMVSLPTMAPVVPITWVAPPERWLLCSSHLPSTSDMSCCALVKDAELLPFTVVSLTAAPPAPLPAATLSPRSAVRSDGTTWGGKHGWELSQKDEGSVWMVGSELSGHKLFPQKQIRKNILC